MPLAEGNTLLDFLTLTSPSENTYETTTLAASGPSRAFGGCTIAAGIAAASASVPPDFHCFSVLGNFLGPALADRILTCTVTPIRSTRSFCTRYVQISQKLDNGSIRTCMVVLADFQVFDAAAADEIFNYSEPPSRVYSGVSASTPPEAIADDLLARSLITPSKHAAILNAKSDMRSRSFESRYCPEGILGQTLSLTAAQPRIPTSQDHLPMHARASADWFRAKQKLSEKVHQWALMAFVLDGPTGWVPLLHDQRGLEEFEAVASLEFALRFFVPAVGGGEERKSGTESGVLDCNEWQLREIKSTVAGGGRTFFEGKVWDGRGRLVASFTQQDIARPKKKMAGKERL